MTNLTDRHRLNIAALRLSGCSEQGVAHFFGCSPRTVKRIMANLPELLRSALLRDEADLMEQFLHKESKARIDRRTELGKQGKYIGLNPSPRDGRVIHEKMMRAQEEQLKKW